MKTTEQLLEDALPVECAVAHAGEQVMLCISARVGRTPIKQVLVSGNELGWESADGMVESLFLTGASAAFDLHQLVADVQSEDGLLVMEMQESSDTPPVHWIMSSKTEAESNSPA